MCVLEHSLKPSYVHHVIANMNEFIPTVLNFNSWQRILLPHFSNLFLFVLSRRPLQVSAWYAGKEVPRTHPICNAMLIYHPLFRIVLGYPLHCIMFTQRSATFEGNHVYGPMRCVCETKLALCEAHFHFQVTRCAIFLACFWCLAGLAL